MRRYSSRYVDAFAFRNLCRAGLDRPAGYTLLGSLAFLCTFAAISVFFSVNLFGNRWLHLTSEKDRSSLHLRSALDNVAHDFRSIVQSLRTELRLLKSLKSLELRSDIVGRLSRTIGQFDLITDDFRASVLGKIGGDTSPTTVELFLRFVVRHVVEYHNSRRFSEGSTIRATCAPNSGLCFVMAHVAQINRLLGNLWESNRQRSRGVSRRIDKGCADRAVGRRAQCRHPCF